MVFKLLISCFKLGITSATTSDCIDAVVREYTAILKFEDIIQYILMSLDIRLIQTNFYSMLY